MKRSLGYIRNDRAVLKFICKKVHEFYSNAKSQFGKFNIGGFTLNYHKNEGGTQAMEISAYNPLKGRLETINIDVTDENTTWFDESEEPLNDDDIEKIVDTEHGILIYEAGYGQYPVLISGETRADVDHNKEKARRLLNDTIEEYL